jgi:xanthine dehydrogenase small subunit
MRDYLVFYINGKQHRVSGEQVFMPLSSYLRYEQAQTGTKVVCEEGDCGACTVALGRLSNGTIEYRAVNSCIQFLYQLDCTHVVTVEGLKYNGQINPIQQAMVDCHGAQCGYCTPGFVVAMCTMFERQGPACQQDVKDGLTGNLCRCTGYEPIIKAALSVDAAKVQRLNQLYPPQEMIKHFAEHASVPALINGEEKTYFNPTDLDGAIDFKARRASTVVVAGGTDVCVYWNKRGIEPRHLMSLAHVPDLRQCEIVDGQLVVGALTTLSEIEDVIAGTIPELGKILWLFGSPQIRNAGTLAGNIANGSPIADSLPFLHVMEAQLELAGTKGRRRVNINDFYKGYKQLDLAPDELITRILIPLPADDEILKLYKVSKRKHLDISAFTAAFRLTLKAGTIEKISIAYGGVAATILRLKKTEEFLRGKAFNLDILRQAGVIARREITPISDVRGSADFRLTLAENIMSKLYYEIHEQEKVPVCRP